MSDSDDQPVMVEYPSKEEEEERDKTESAEEPWPNSPKVEKQEEAPKEKVENEEDGVTSPQPLQIVSVGTEEDAYAFTFHEDKLNSIVSKVPAGWKVSVVSVVGAFRTGKSFLLSWFLRYLDHQGKEENTACTGKKWYEEYQSLGNDGFDWRGGADRNTTGIWMWSEPHFIKKDSGEQIAIVLVDTQGMFDHETTMALTASIFGLSTLLSSYQIYNVDKRIQEDNLQQLALFSEYARMAMTTYDKKSAASKPFQHIEFLVRDWQNFDEEDDYDLMEKEMGEYLEKVISNRDAKDLQETREQILGCFEKVSCYAMTHPGFAVTKKKYNGDVSAIDEQFTELLDRYCRRVFNLDNIMPKKIHGRELTAVELGAYIKAYAGLFTSGAQFPEATTLLEATAGANNTNALHMAMSEYKDRMDRIAGPQCSNYIRQDELKELNVEIVATAMEVFESIATFGNQRDIDSAKEKVAKQVTESFEVYTSLNEGRNPLKGMEMYLIPLTIALGSYVLRILADFTCSGWSQTCKVASEALSHFYAVAFCFMAIIAATKAKQIQASASRLKAGFDAMQADKAKSD